MKTILFILTTCIFLSCSQSKKARKSNIPTGEAEPAYLGYRIDRIGDEEAYDDGHYIKIPQDTLFISTQQ